MSAMSTLVRAAAALAALSGAAAAPAQSEKSITVQDLLRDQDKLNGEVVTVRGYIRECVAARCNLYWRQQDWSSRTFYFISIGPDAAFDQATRGHLPGNVVLKGTLDTKCTNRPPKATYCPGRPAALSQVEIVRWGK